jgi:hypothetical protein
MAERVSATFPENSIEHPKAWMNIHIIGYSKSWVLNTAHIKNYHSYGQALQKTEIG